MKDTWTEYASAWSTKDPARRQTILEKRLSPEVVYTDPQTQLLGYHQLSEYMQRFQSGFPGRHFVIENVVVHHQVCLAYWSLQNEKSEIEMRGASFAEFKPDNRLVRICGFFGDAVD
jgi:hypothetical protein